MFYVDPLCLYYTEVSSHHAEKVDKFLGMIFDDRIITMCDFSADVGYEVALNRMTTS